MNLYAGNGFVAVPVSGHAFDAEACRLIGEQYPGRVGDPGSGRRARLRRRRRALHHPTGARRDRAHRVRALAVARARRPTDAFAVARRSGAGRWHPDPAEHDRAVADGIRAAAREGARLVCLPELTRSPYFAVERRDPEHPGAVPEAAARRPDVRPRRRRCARETGAYVHASCYEAADDGGSRLQHRVRRRARRCARRADRARCTPGHRGLLRGHVVPAAATRAGRSRRIESARFGFPTCWDQWFPETSRAFALGGADVLVYPTAIGSEPDHPDFDTEPLWEQVIRAQGIMNGTFMVAVNRIGTEGPAHVLRLVVRQRSVRPGARAGAACGAGGARRRPRSRPAPRLARRCSRSCATRRPGDVRTVDAGVP